MRRTELENGFVICSMNDEFREALPQFYVDVFTEIDGPVDQMLGIWAGDLLSPHHPTVTDDDVWMVIDPAQDNRILSALLLIPQIWHYEAVKLGVGRIELVATHREYRNRGFTRQLMEIAHQRSAELGHTLQAITGIPHFYRQFGYTMAVKLGPDTLLPFSGVKGNDQPQYTLRPAALADIPCLMQWYNTYAQQVLLSVERTEKQWAHEITTRPMGIPPSVHYFIIENRQAEGVGYCGIRDFSDAAELEILEYVVGDKASYLDTFDDVAWAAKQYASEKDSHLSYMVFDSGIHPTVSTLVRKSPGGITNRPTYAWYIRAASVAHLIQKIAPVLERRLQGSGAHHYTGQVKFAFHDKTGLLMNFEGGKLIDASDIEQDFRGADGAFPWHSFLNLVLGHHTLDDLRAVFPDAYANKTAAVLLEILFPRKQAWVMGQL